MILSEIRSLLNLHEPAFSTNNQNRSPSGAMLYESNKAESSRSPDLEITATAAQSIGKPLPLEVKESVEPHQQINTETENPSKTVAIQEIIPSPEAIAREQTRKLLLELYDAHMGSNGKYKIKPHFLKVMRPNLPHSTGDEITDNLICLAYVFVNTSQHENAETLFRLILQYREDAAAALIGLGSIHAMHRRYELAIADFSKAIAIDKTVADAWKRRGQTRAAAGEVKSALRDLTQALELSQSDPDIYNQRGLVYHQIRDYKSAVVDFRTALKKGMSTAALFNYVGMCEGLLGNIEKSIAAHLEAVKIDKSFKEAHLNIGMMHKENGEWQKALIAFQNSMEASDGGTFYQVYVHRSLLYYQLGDLRASLGDVNMAVEVIENMEKRDIPHVVVSQHLVQCCIRGALCHQSTGWSQLSNISFSFLKQDSIMNSSFFDFKITNSITFAHYFLYSSFSPLHVT